MFGDLRDQWVKDAALGIMYEIRHPRFNQDPAGLEIQLNRFVDKLLGHCHRGGSLGHDTCLPCTAVRAQKAEAAVEALKKQRDEAKAHRDGAQATIQSHATTISYLNKRLAAAEDDLRSLRQQYQVDLTRKNAALVDAQHHGASAVKAAEDQLRSSRDEITRLTDQLDIVTKFVSSWKR